MEYNPRSFVGRGDLFWKNGVYFSLIEEQLAQEKQVLFLLPEISLTAQMVQRLSSVLGNKDGFPLQVFYPRAGRSVEVHFA